MTARFPKIATGVESGGGQRFNLQASCKAFCVVALMEALWYSCCSVLGTKSMFEEPVGQKSHNYETIFRYWKYDIREKDWPWVLPTSLTHMREGKSDGLAGSYTFPKAGLNAAIVKDEQRTSVDDNHFKSMASARTSTSMCCMQYSEPSVSGSRFLPAMPLLCLFIWPAFLQMLRTKISMPESTFMG